MTRAPARVPAATVWLLLILPFALPPGAFAKCAPSPRIAVQLEVTDCTARSQRVLTVEGRTAAHVTFAPFLENCPAPGVVRADPGAGDTRTYLYYVTGSSRYQSCEQLTGEADARWMLSREFCCNVRPPSEACREGFRRLDDLDGHYLRYLVDADIVEGPAGPVCSEPSRALDVVVEDCTAGERDTILLGARVTREMRFAPYPFNCPLPELVELESPRSQRFVHPWAGACEDYPQGSRRWMWSPAACCEEGSREPHCRLGLTPIIDVERNPAVDRLLIERGYRIPPDQ